MQNAELFSVIEGMCRHYKIPTRNKVTTGAGRGIVFRLILAFTIPLSKFVCRGDLWSPVLFCDCLRAINDRPYE